MRWVQPTRDRRNAVTREQILDRLRGEFREMPCLRLTPAQAQRLFGLRRDVCERVLHTLVVEGTLCPDGTGRFARCESPAALVREVTRRA